MPKVTASSLKTNKVQLVLEVRVFAGSKLRAVNDRVGGGDLETERWEGMFGLCSLWGGACRFLLFLK